MAAGALFNRLRIEALLEFFNVVEVVVLVVPVVIVLKVDANAKKEKHNNLLNIFMSMRILYIINHICWVYQS